MSNYVQVVDVMTSYIFVRYEKRKESVGCQFSIETQLLI